MKKHNAGIAAIVIVLVTLVMSCSGKEDSSPADTVSILSISPASADQNQNTTFAVNVSYSLASKDSGLLMIGFNTREVDAFDLISSETYTVSKGSGNHTFNVAAVPVDWGAAGDFQAYVNLSENPHSTLTWEPLASNVKTIDVPAAISVLKSVPLPSACREEVCF